MPIGIELEVFGDVQLRRNLLRFEEKARDASPAFEQIAKYLRGVERRQFATHGESSSGGWAPLSPATLRKRYARLHGTRLRRGQFTRKALVASQAILVDTGKLRDSLTKTGGPEHVEEIGQQEMEFGTRVAYAKYHQHGTSRMPRRRPVELTEQQRKQCVRILQRHLMEEFKRLGPLNLADR